MAQAVFRFDAAKDLGLGHAYRCAALANRLNFLGWDCYAAIPKNDRLYLPEKVDQEFKVIELEVDGSSESKQIFQQIGSCEVLVIDHYSWGHELESSCRAWCSEIVVISDITDVKHDCDYLIDQAYSRVPSDYIRQVPHGCKLFLGTRYALMFQRFLKLRALRIQSDCESAIPRILINFGGTDLHHHTYDALLALRQLNTEINVDVVVGALEPDYLESLRAKVREFGSSSAMHVQTDKMPELMLNADLAIGGGGVATWERASLGLPVVIILQADNQSENCKIIDEHKAGIYLCSFRDFDRQKLATVIETVIANPKLLKQMSQNAFSLCNASGSNLVSAAIFGMYVGKHRITLRPATEEDCELIYTWQTEPEVRRYARNSEVPSFEEHKKWFASKLKEENNIFALLECDGLAAGVIRLDYSDPACAEGEVSIYLSARFHGQGIARVGLILLRNLSPFSKHIAYVLAENKRSHKLFLSSGYTWENDRYVSEPRQE